ncbi:hypothetical protein A2U01_0083871, partial [Trifolium medium]|nr:hypothetical protein [Trifolium medium]
MRPTQPPAQNLKKLRLLVTEISRHISTENFGVAMTTLGLHI